MNQNQMESQLELYKSFYDTYPDAVLVLQEGVVIACNELVYKLFQVDNQWEVINKKLSNFSSKDAQKKAEHSELEEYFDTFLLNGQNAFEWTFQNKKGDLIYTKIFLSEIKINESLLLQVVVRDTTEQKKAEQQNQKLLEELQTGEEELRQNLEELEAQRDYIQEINKDIKTKSEIIEKNSQVLLELNKSQDIYTGNLNTAFEIITKKAAQTLNIQRVGIWKYDTTNEVKIICQKQYETTKSGYVFTQNAEIKQKDTPKYFADIITEKNIVADFAPNHPVLVEFIDSYLIPLGIKSMLDIPYFIDGKLAGVICCEAQSQYKNWTNEDIAFVKSVADIITIVIKTQQQLQEQEKVRQNEKHLFQFLNGIPVGVSVFSKSKEMVFVNDVAKKMLGYDIEQTVTERQNTNLIQLRIVGTEEDYPEENLPHILALHGKQTHIDDLEIIRGSEHTLLEVTGSPIYTDNGEVEFSISVFQDISDRKSKELEIKKKNEELAATEEELRQNMEELQATQEAMREKQSVIEEAKVALENQNQKLFNNEAVLKKTFEKMKLQETQLKDSLNSMQTQEEELRQNMEELEATQEILVKAQLEQEKLVSIIKNLDALVVIASTDGKIEFLNEKGKVLLNFYKDYKGRSISEFHSEEGAKISKEVIMPTVMQKGFWKGDHQLQNQVTKEIVNTFANVFVIRDPNTNKPIALASVQIDITEQKKLEKSIQDQNERLQASEEELRQNMEEMQATQEVMNQKQILIEEAKVSLEKQNKKLLANESILKKTFEKMKLQETQLKDSFASLQAQEEELRQNMEEMEATQERVNSAFSELDGQFNAISAAFGYIELDSNRKITRVNPLAAKWLEYEVDELQTKAHIDLIPNNEEDKDKYDKLWKALEDGKTYVDVFKRKTKFDNDLWLFGAYCPIKNDIGEIVRVIKIASNYNTQKQTEIEVQTRQQELLATEEELRQNMEELQATQEAMREKQTIIEESKIFLEKQNSKLSSNEAVLKKAFEKMKIQDVKLRESLDALQTQEEELRQNMEELQTTQEVMAYQKDVLEISNRQITKSISYAKTIQNAFLPSKTQLKKLLPESFVIYKPKDIVSGDLYWLSEHGNKKLISVIDCTGHGVPGAFMSLVASSILSEIINQKGILQPNLILNELHKGVVKKLNQKEGANNDGMDLTFCLLEQISDNQTKLTFAGVKQNLYIIRNKELIELKGNRSSIGGGKRDDERNYVQEEIVLQKDDSIFLATDGYADQADPERRSFSKKNFRELMLEVGHLSAKEQLTIFEKRLAEHQQETEQRDDITVLGFKI